MRRFAGPFLFFVVMIVVCHYVNKASSTKRFSLPEKLTILQDIRNHSGLIISTNAEILDASHGDPREPDDFRWTLFLKAPERISLPLSGGVNEPISTTDTAISVKVLQLYVKAPILNPQVALSSDWHAQQFGFEAFVVRTPQGDYFHLDQYSNCNY